MAKPKEPAPSDIRAQRPTYVEAIAIYEQAIRMLQQHAYAKAAELLRHVVTRYRDERELSERARLYLALCERQLQPPADEPENTPERLYAATLALNAGDHTRALSYLSHVTREEPSNDQALYLLAVAYAGQGQAGLAIRYLQQAIETNAENRARARFDPDLESLRAEPRVIELLDVPSHHRRQTAGLRPQPSGHRPSSPSASRRL